MMVHTPWFQVPSSKFQVGLRPLKEERNRSFQAYSCSIRNLQFQISPFGFNMQNASPLIRAPGTWNLERGTRSAGRWSF